MTIYNVQLSPTNNPNDVLHPETSADVVLLSDGKTLTQKLTNINQELTRKLGLTGGTLTGNLTAPTFIGALNGNASTATKLQTARQINGVAFDGTKNITVQDATKLPLTGGVVNGNVSIDHLLPNLSTSDLGNSTNRFNKVYAQDIYAGGYYLEKGNMWISPLEGDLIIQMRVSGGEGHLRSFRNAVDSVGSSSERWKNIYASNGTIQTSDERFKVKQGLTDIDECYRMIKEIDIYNYIMLPVKKEELSNNRLGQLAMEESQKDSSVHMGVMAQDIQKYDCAKQILVEGEYECKDGTMDKMWSINPYNLTIANMAAIKVLMNKVEQLKEEIQELKTNQTN